MPSQDPQVNTARNLVVLWLGRVVSTREVHALMYPAQQPAFAPASVRKASAQGVTAWSTARRLEQRRSFSRGGKQLINSTVPYHDPFQGTKFRSPAARQQAVNWRVVVRQHLAPLEVEWGLGAHRHQAGTKRRQFDPFALHQRVGPLL